MKTGRRVMAPVSMAVALAVHLGATVPQAPPSQPASALSCAQMETFLANAKIGRRRDLGVGVTIPSRATLDDGTFQHDAAIQTVNETKSTFQTSRGTELNFRDSWQFNVAGYQLAKMLQLNMVAPYVERRVSGVDASVSWWINDAMMERDRYQKKISPPDPRTWTREMSAVRLFHELVGDSDFNMTNILITKDWRIWMIDFSRAFRLTKSLQKPNSLTTVDRRLLANLRSLTPETVQQTAGRWLTSREIEAVIARRDAIVKHLESQVAAKGEAVVLYDLPRTSEPCGTGLQ